MSHPLHKQATNSQYGYALLTTIICTANDALCTDNDHIMVILHSGWELQLRNESQ
jgi:hypothetical protein